MPRYELHDVPLIPQTMTIACWYAAAQMLIVWRRQRTRMSEISHPDPSQVPALANQFASNERLPFGRTVELARSLSLRAMPLMTPTPDALAGWLFLYGPLWFAGR